jgi:hypothetical protein
MRVQTITRVFTQYFIELLFGEGKDLNCLQMGVRICDVLTRPNEFERQATPLFPKKI